MFALVDNRINEPSLSKLTSLGIDTFLMPSADYLQEGVSSHPDMLVFLGLGRLICHSLYYEKNKQLIDRIASLSGSKLTLSNEKIGKDYPLDVLFNACLLGNKLICNTRTVSRLILQYAEEYGCDIVHISQGYAKCSIAVVSDNAVITSDIGIAKACNSSGMDVLTVSEGYVSLPPYDYGFIGGASGNYGNKVFFCGSLDTHPDNKMIRSFCKKHGAEIIELSSCSLLDVGSIFFV